MKHSSADRKFPDPRIVASAALFAIAGLAGSLAASAAPQDPPRDTIKLAYDIYGKGFKLMELELAIALDRSSYQARSDLKTVGMAKIFAKFKARYETEGRIARGALKPRRFRTFTKKGGKDAKTASIEWTRKGRIKAKLKPRESKHDLKEIKQVLKPGMPDPLTNMVHLVAGLEKSPCSHTQRIYDGRKIFDVGVKYAGRHAFKVSDFTLYQGPAIKCTIVDRAVAGFSKKKRARLNNKNREPFILWLAPVIDRKSNRKLLVPLFVTGATTWANVTVRLTSASINGHALKSLSLASN